jgi:hypothetical protein
MNTKSKLIFSVYFLFLAAAFFATAFSSSANLSQPTVLGVQTNYESVYYKSSLPKIYTITPTPTCNLDKKSK